MVKGVFEKMTDVKTKICKKEVKEDVQQQKNGNPAE